MPGTITQPDIDISSSQISTSVSNVNHFLGNESTTGSMYTLLRCLTGISNPIVGISNTPLIPAPPTSAFTYVSILAGLTFGIALLATTAFYAASILMPANFVAQILSASTTSVVSTAFAGAMGGFSRLFGNATNTTSLNQHPQANRNSSTLNTALNNLGNSQPPSINIDGEINSPAPMQATQQPQQSLPVQLTSLALQNQLPINSNVANALSTVGIGAAKDLMNSVLVSKPTNVESSSLPQAETSNVNSSLADIPANTVPASNVNLSALTLRDTTIRGGILSLMNSSYLNSVSGYGGFAMNMIRSTGVLPFLPAVVCTAITVGVFMFHYSANISAFKDRATTFLYGQSTQSAPPKIEEELMVPKQKVKPDKVKKMSSKHYSSKSVNSINLLDSVINADYMQPNIVGARSQSESYYGRNEGQMSALDEAKGKFFSTSRPPSDRYIAEID